MKTRRIILASILLSYLLIITINNTQGQIRITSNGDTINGDIKKLIEVEYGISFIKKIYKSNKVNNTIKGDIYDITDTLIGTYLIQYDNNGYVLENTLLCHDGDSCQNWTFKYDAKNRIVYQRYIHYGNNKSYPGKCNHLIDILRGTLSNWAIMEGSAITIANYSYDNNGNYKEALVMYILNGIEISDTTTERTQYEHDTSGNIIREYSIKLATTRHADTIIKTTDYIYDNKHNKKIETFYTNTPTYNLQNWNCDGREITTKTTYEYDDENKLVEMTEYFTQNEYYPITRNDTSERKRGKLIGGGIKYTYDSIGNNALYIRYSLYRNENGIESKKVTQTTKASKNEDEDAVVEYDLQGNIIKKTYKGKIILKREIEYY